MPLIIGSVTPRAAATATEASKALPPSSSTSTPARVAEGLAELTMPDPATAGVLTVFCVGSISTLATGVGISASVSSPTVASSETLSSAALGAPSETEDRAPQELRTATTDNTTKAMKKIFLKKKCSSNELRILAQRITPNEKNNRGAAYSGGPAYRR